jgi:hypothetical protein
MEFGTALAHDDVARLNELAPELANPEELRIAVRPLRLEPTPFL